MPLLEKLEETEEDHIDYAKDIKTVSQIKSATLARLERHMGGCTTQSLRLPEWISGEFDAVLKKVRDIKPNVRQEKDLMDKKKKYMTDAKAIHIFIQNQEDF